MGSQDRRDTPFTQQLSPQLHRRADAVNSNRNFASQRTSNSHPSSPSSACFHRFDNIETAWFQPEPSLKTVILVGYPGRVTVYDISPEKNDVVCRLEGLRGRVLQAKLLPTTSRHDDFAQQRPLIAMVIEGPASRDEVESRHTANSKQRLSDYEGQSNYHYFLQTKVEIYSLKTGDHVTSLYKSEVFHVSHGSSGNTFSSLEVEACGKFITVSARKSGEIFVFTNAAANSTSDTEIFRCIGKFWTTVQSDGQSAPYDPVSAALREPSTQDESQIAPRSSLSSLSGRWLATVPPRSSLRLSVRGQASVHPPGTTPPGLDTHVAPQTPQPNATTESMETETLMNRMARGVAQEVVKGARWAGAQGLQAWRNYWNGPQATPAVSASLQSNIDPRFPPTHAEPDLDPVDSDWCKFVSIIDLERLVQADQTNSKSNAVYQATFEVPNGCSSLSFSHNGLFLLTVSQSGDTQYFWNLFDLGPFDRYSSSSNINRDNRSKSMNAAPRIRQAKKISRVTNANVVDVVWSEISENHVAIVTNKCTIHVFDLPRSTFEWPVRDRGKSRSMSVASTDASEGNPSQQQDARLPITEQSLMGSAIQSLSSTTQPFIRAVRNRRSSSSTGGIFDGFNSTAAHSVRSSRALAANVSRSLGAATGRNEFEIRIRLPTNPNSLSPGCVMFMSGTTRGMLASVSDNVVRIYELSSGNLLRESALRVPDEQQSRVLGSALLTSNSVEHSQQDVKSSPAPLSQAEIETSAPFRPLHTRRGYTLSAYVQPEPWERELQAEEQVSAKDEPWCFGSMIPSVRVAGGEDLSASSMLLRREARDGTAERGIERIVIADPERRRRSSAKAEQQPDIGQADAISERSDEGGAGFFEKGVTVLDIASDEEG